MLLRSADPQPNTYRLVAQVIEDCSPPWQFWPIPAMRKVHENDALSLLMTQWDGLSSARLLIPSKSSFGTCRVLFCPHQNDTHTFLCIIEPGK